ncbi:MAG: hypothetical protein P4M09_19650 [Devosia sp.]|nr:hypothetical protein [Devosia sp.]
MKLIATLAGLLGIESDLLLQRLKDDAVALSAIGIMVLVGVVFLLVALHTWLSGWIGPLWAPLAIAGGAFVIALICYGVLRIQQASLRRREAEHRQAAASRALVVSTALGALPELLANPVVRNVGLPVAIYAALLLFAAPRKPKPETDKE